MVKMAVEHTEVGNKSDLIVFLRDGESLCSPFRIIVVSEDSNVTEAVDLSLEKGKKQMWNLIGFAMIGLGIWIGKFDMDWFAWKFAELARKWKGVFFEHMPKSTMLHTVEVSQNHVINFDLVVICS